MRALWPCLLASALLVTGCASSPPLRAAPATPAVRSAPPAAARAEPRPRCAGVSVTLDEQGSDGARHVALACDVHGARLVVSTSPRDMEGSFDERTLDLAEANRVWAAIAAVRWQALACAGEGAARVRRSLRVAGPGGEQTATCDADRPSAGWAAIEAALAPPPPTAADMELWQFQAEYWRDELGYARATPALAARLPGVSP